MERFEGVIDNRGMNQLVGDPMHLHSADHPGILLVSFPLNSTNYRARSRAMKIAPGAKHKLGFIDGGI